MQVSVETMQGLERRLTMSISKQKVDSEIQSRLNSLKQKAKFDGFRPGKVPLSFIKKKYQNAVRQEVMGELMQSTFYAAITQEKLRPAGMPHIDSVDSADANTEEIEFTATFEVYPDITLAEMSNVTIEKPGAEITDAEVEKMIGTIRKQHVEWSVVTRSVQQGDRVMIDFEGKIDGEVFEGGVGKDFPLEIGLNRMIPGFEEKLIGMDIGQQRDLDLNFPDDYHAGDVAGKSVSFQVTLTKVEEPKIPELDEEFVKKMGVAEGDIAAFQAQVMANMTREAATSTQSKIKQNVMTALLAQNQIEVPKVLVDNEIEALLKQRQEALGDQPLEIKAEMFEDEARRRVSLGLILSEVVKQNDIKVEPAKLRETVESIAAGYDQPEAVVSYYYSDKQKMAEIENYALEQEVVSWALSQSTIAEKQIGFDELMAK